MGDVTLLPRAAAAAVCHDEQVEIWVSEMVGALALGGFLTAGLTYGDRVELRWCVEQEIRRTVEAAFEHPEARTILSSRKRS